MDAAKIIELVDNSDTSKMGAWLLTLAYFLDHPDPAVVEVATTLVSKVTDGFKVE